MHFGADGEFEGKGEFVGGEESVDDEGGCFVAAEEDFLREGLVLGRGGWKLYATLIMGGEGEAGEDCLQDVHLG